jgi:hypothetical protein
MCQGGLGDTEAALESARTAFAWTGEEDAAYEERRGLVERLETRASRGP